MEGAGDDLEWMLFYAAAACPYYYLWTSRDMPAEEWLKRSLVFGAYPMAPRMPRPGPDPDTDALYDAYLPLYEVLRRRVLSFDPDPLRLPLGTWGQLYTVPGDRYACVVVRDGASCFDSVQHRQAPEVEVRAPRDFHTARVHYPGPDAAEGNTVEFGRSDQGVVVPLAEMKSAAVVVLE
jgi:hypothetical protein